MFPFPLRLGIGVLEYWSNAERIVPTLHHSTTPSLHLFIESPKQKRGQSHFSVAPSHALQQATQPLRIGRCDQKVNMITH